MTAKELITELLNMDMAKKISIEYPTPEGAYRGNYSRFEETENFILTEYEHGIIIGIDYDN